MRAFSWLLACAVGSSVAYGAVWAQTVPSTSSLGGVAASITLHAALEAAWQRSVAARESDAQRQRAQADGVAATSFGAAPPSLQLSHRDDRLHDNFGKRESEIAMAVALWLPGQRAARAHAADASLAQTQAAEQVARLRLAGELREAAWQIAAMQAEAIHADNQVHLLQQLVDDVARRVRAGDFARADVLAAQAELLAALALQTDVRQRLRAAHARWTLLTGLNAAPDLTVADGVDPMSGTTLSHPALRLADQSTELARKRVELTRVSRRDAPELTVGLRQDVPGRTDAMQSSLVVGLRLPFSADERNRSLEAAALADLSAAQTHEQRLLEQLDSDSAGARDALRSAEGQLESETARARLLRERATLIEKSYRAGEAPLPDLLRALAAAAQADSAAARQSAALGLARARFHQTLGLLP